MKNLKISKKLTLSFVVILILLITGTAVSIIKLVSFSNQIEEFYNGPFVVKGSADIINASFESMQKAVYRTIANEDQAFMKESIESAKDAGKIIEEQFLVVQEHFLGDQDIITRLEEQFEKLVPMREEVLSLGYQKKERRSLCVYGGQ